jgi:hypothetical protein
LLGHLNRLLGAAARAAEVAGEAADSLRL